MHRIIANHLKSFVEDNGLDADPESVQFEKFANYCLLRQKMASTVEIDTVTTGNDDDGIDGIALIINEEHVFTPEDSEVVFAADRKANDVEISFIQAKRSEHFDLGDFLKFKEAILRFVQEEPYTSNSETQRDARSAFDIAIANVTKIRNGKPNLSATFVTTGSYQSPDELETAKETMVADLDDLGLFHLIDIRFYGRDDLIKLWMDSHNGIQASLTMVDSASLPEISGVVEAYLVIVRAKEYVDKFLVNDDGSVRGQLFEENVRHFLGSANPVNTQIRETILNPQERSRFPVLNNGVTIVSPDVRIQGTTLHVSNFQIVNGCQTSHVLYENRAEISDDIMLTLKIVETTDEDVFSELVKATNSQTKVEDSQFQSLNPLTKAVEAYFNTYDGEDGRLYFERRDRQYVGRTIPALRIVSLKDAAKGVCSMFLRRPDIASRYPKRMHLDFGSEIFDVNNKEIMFYAAALTAYRFHLLVSNSTIPQNMRRLKWHILPLVAAIVSGKKVPPRNSRKMEKFAQKIIDVFQSHNTEATQIIQKAISLIEDPEDISFDRLKRQSVLEDALRKI